MKVKESHLAVISNDYESANNIQNYTCQCLFWSALGGLDIKLLHSNYNPVGGGHQEDIHTG